MKDNIKISKVEHLSNYLLDPTQISNLDLGDQSKIKQILQMKTTSHGQRPASIKRGISQHPLIGYYSNFKLKLRLPKMKLTNL
jgi:hypothetical protein